MKKLIDIKQTSPGFEYQLAPDAKNCQFLEFLINSSDFSWNKPSTEQTVFDAQKKGYHLVSKLCAIGYLMQPVKTEDCKRAVVAMDPEGYEMGCNGKSLFANVLGSMLSCVMIHGRSRFEDSSFAWQNVEKSTKLIIIDDLHINFNFHFLFDAITGDLAVDAQGRSGYIIPYKDSPKFILTTNHRIYATDQSTQRRIWKLTFSDYYNRSNLLNKSFPNLFISEWDDEQWQLMNQLVAQCILLFHEFGVVQA